MPNNVDFSDVKELKTIEVNPPGWISPLYIEYGIKEDHKVFNKLSYFWKVKGTQHTFVIPVVRLDYLSSGNYKQHFENVLETFREDFLKWKSEGFTSQWSREYREQFERFIVI